MNNVTDPTRLVKMAQRRMLRWMLGGFWQAFPRNNKPEENVRRGAVDVWADEDLTDDEPTEDEEDEIQQNDTWIDWIRRRTRLTEIVLTKKGERATEFKRSGDESGHAGHIARRDNGRRASALIDLRPDGFRSRGRRKSWT